MAVGKIIGGVAGLGLVGASYLGVAGQDDTVRDEAGNVLEAGEVGAFRIQLGDCLADDIEGDFESVTAVPCAQPHTGEVFHAFNLQLGDEFPGLAAVQNAADAGCYRAFEPFVGIDYESSVYYFGAITPTESSWDGVDDREVLCVIAGEPGTTQTGTAQGTAR
jgi:hypothetical protein